MMVSVETTAGLERRMTVQVPADKIESEIDSRLRRYGKTAKIKGFRPGKVPMQVVRQRYGGQVREEVLNEMMRSSFIEALGQEKLRPAGGPRIEPGRLEQGVDLEYTATFEVYPEITLTGHEGMKIRRPTAEITEADIDDMMDRLRRQRAEWEVTEKAAEDGDQITVDFSGTLDGEPFAGGEGQGVPVVLGRGAMLPDFETGLMGMSAGQEKEITVNFPDDYGAAELAGRTAVFQVTARAVAVEALPEVDDAFCESFGITEGGVEQLRKEVADNMARELAQVSRARMREQVLEQLIDANETELPRVLVEQEIRVMQASAARRMGLDPSDSSNLPPAETLEPQASRRVKLGLLVAEVIGQADIQLDQARVRQRLMELAASSGRPEEVIKLYTSSPEMMGQIEAEVMEGQVVDWLIEHAETTDETSSFAELMQPA
jgi:trigger factor